MQKYILALVVWFFPSAVLIAAPCASPIAMPESTPSSQFEYNQNDLVVTDKKTGLMWMRCTVGFTWNPEAGTCESPQASGMPWQSALAIARDIKDASAAPYLGYNDWRLPNVKELATIIERNCPSLSINSDVFPGTLATAYWSNTHKLDSTKGEVYVVNFSNGGLNLIESDKLVLLRLVRDVN